VSSVTDIILILGCGEEKADRNTRSLNSWLREHSHSPAELTKVDDHVIGGKAFQAEMYIAAVNYMDKDEFLAEFKGYDWEMSQEVQLWIKEEHEDRFRIYK
jgi:hypothetical protein